MTVDGLPVSPPSEVTFRRVLKLTCPSAITELVDGSGNAAIYSQERARSMLHCCACRSPQLSIRYNHCACLLKPVNSMSHRLPWCQITAGPMGAYNIILIGLLTVHGAVANICLSETRELLFADATIRAQHAPQTRDNQPFIRLNSNVQ